MNLLPRSFITTLALSACTIQTSTSGAVKPDDAIQAETKAGEVVDHSPALVPDPAVKTGTLPNGLTYYIRKHPKPDNRVLLWLAVNAGSVLEDDDQKGLAHFVEHMAFNGTERFEKNTIIDFFEKSGMDFGADVNAYTSFDETVYMLQVPTDDAQLLKTGYDVIEDWAGAVSFDPQEVDKERGVVIEEWRLGRGARQRIFDKQWPVFLAGSKYADRKPIGDKTILETASVDRLKAFYKDWYRPDNMAVIVVGDIDPATVLQEIETRFSDLQNPVEARPRVNVPVPLLDQTRIEVLTDNEMTRSQVTVALKAPRSTFTTEQGFREELVDNLFHGMMRARLDEIRQRPDSPFAFAFSYTTEMGRAIDMFQLVAGAKPGQAGPTTNALLAELERVRRHGFTTSEFNRITVEHLRDLERAVAEADTVKGNVYAFGLANQFLEGHTMISRQEELRLARQFIPQLKLEEINQYAETWASYPDRVVTAAGPARETMPSRGDLLAIVDGISAAPIEPWDDGATGGSLMAQAPKPGSVTKKERIDEIGVSVWTLSNGARVVLKPTDFKNDEVLLKAFSPGGHSLASDPAFESAKWADSIISNSGVGEYDEVALGKLLSGKVVQVAPWIDELEEGVQGSASPQDLEVLMQLTHLYFTAPRKDAQAFDAWKGRMNTVFTNRDLNPQAVFFDEFNKAANGNHERRQPPSVESLAKVSLDTAFDFYQQRFADAGDFTFVFVGNIDESRLEALSAKYLASLPSQGRKEKWRDVKVKPPKGIKKVRVDQGQDPKSYVVLAYHGNTRWTPEVEDDLEMLSEALGIRLRETLREDMSGVYGVFSNGQIERRPKIRYQYMVGFGCSPDNVNALKTAVFDLVNSFKKDGAQPDVIDKLKQQRRRGFETDRQENRFWLTELTEHFLHGTDPRQILDQEKMVERVNSSNIQRAARRYLGKQYVDALLMPEATNASPKSAGASQEG